MKANRIAVLTDFGTQDAYVGLMKIVIDRIKPGAPVLDLTHEIPRGDIHWGAFTLMTSLRYFPEGTVVLAVIDPGVGSKRKGLCIQAGPFWLVGPDNGLFSYVLRDYPAQAIYSLENPGYFLERVSPTFHGRDIFAPVSAHLLNGVSPSDLGPALTEIVKLEWPEVKTQAHQMQGEVLFHDHFGNLITNISREDMEACRNLKIGPHENLNCSLQINGHVLTEISSTYSQSQAGQLLALWGSSDFLEIAVNQGNAKNFLKAGKGTQILLKP